MTFDQQNLIIHPQVQVNMDGNIESLGRVPEISHSWEWDKHNALTRKMKSVHL